ncbi:hypothetical protein RUM44_006548 [Polyplax serrata]|uniref:Uncharacterized protein n=1 Tax=Polyplax serrata TaxID=468196 RepID=A0ABR1AIG8_POLSC
MTSVVSGYTHNPYNGVVCNDTILATGVFSSKELWRLSKASIISSVNGVQPTLNTIKIENPGYYCSSYTPPATDHSSLLTGGTYSPLSLPRSTHSPGVGEPRNKRLRRLSSAEEEMELVREKADAVYYGQSPASLSSQTSWHSDVDHGTVRSSQSPRTLVMGTGHAGTGTSIRAGSPLPPGAPRSRQGISTQHNVVTSLAATSLSVGGYYQTQTPHHSPKYPENGHDTLSDFVTFVCQEAENTQQGQQVQGSVARNSAKLAQYYPSTMLPPPPPPPMARPVAIIRSTGELANSPPTSSTPPMTNSSSPEGHCHDPALSPSPPSLGTDMPSVRVSSVVTSPFAVSREYTFSHIHTQPGQLFSYPNVGGMTGVISPTNLSLFTGPTVSRPQSAAPRSTPIPRWNTPFISLDEDYNMMPLMPGGNPDQGALIDTDERYFSTVTHPEDLEGPGPNQTSLVQAGGPGSTGSSGGAPTPPSRTPNPQPTAGSGPPTPVKSQP